MRRRRTNAPDSLDLLLDTITNAFGGILFLAILVVLLLQMNRHRLEAESDTETAPRPERLAQLRDEITMRRRTLESQAQRVDRLSPVTARELLDQLAAARERRDALHERLRESQGAIGQLQSAVGEAQAVAGDLAAALREARESLTAAQEALTSEIASRQQTARLPRLRSTRKIEVPAVLRYDRVYLIYRDSGFALFRRLNTDEFVVIEEDGGRFTATPKPYAGLTVEATEQFPSRLRQRLASHRKDDIYLAVAVWPDSFGSFVHVKNTLVQAGYEYRLILMENGQSLVQGDVANPLVQ
jgi:hypothetical protein